MTDPEYAAARYSNSVAMFLTAAMTAAAAIPLAVGQLTETTLYAFQLWCCAIIAVGSLAAMPALVNARRTINKAADR